MGIWFAIAGLVATPWWFRSQRPHAALIMKCCWGLVALGVLCIAIPKLPAFSGFFETSAQKTFEQAQADAREIKVLREEFESNLKIIKHSVQEAQSLQQVGADIQAQKEKLDERIAQWEVKTGKADAWLERIEEKNRIFSLADQALVEGSRSAYEELHKSLGKNHDESTRIAIISQILKIKAFYLTGNRFRNIEITVPGANKKDLKNEEIPQNELIKLLQNNEQWPARAKAVELLGNYKTPESAQALMSVIKEDSQLDVVRSAIQSFQKITGFQSGDTFPIDEVQSWWQKNKTTIRFA